MNLTRRYISTSLLENGGQIDAVYTDFEKAFDKVLSSYGISKTVIKWIQDFLTARKFRVRVNLSHSMWSEVTVVFPGQCFRTYFISAVYQ